MNRPFYNNLPFLPALIAEMFCRQGYTCIEHSDGVRSQSFVDEVEKLRQAMTAEQVEEFSNLCDIRCRWAYDAKVKWFDKIVRAKDNSGRNQLYIWISHWLSAYLLVPKNFRASSQTQQKV